MEREGKRRKLVNGLAAWGTDKYIGWELDETLDSQYLLSPPDEVVQNQKVEIVVEIKAKIASVKKLAVKRANKLHLSIWYAAGLIRNSISHMLLAGLIRISIRAHRKLYSVHGKQVESLGCTCYMSRPS